MTRHFLQGRVFAKTYDAAVEKIEARVKGEGYEVKRLCRAWPCLTQHREETWWEYMIEIHVEGSHACVETLL